MRFLIVFFGVLIITSNCFAEIINVPDDFETMQAGIDASEDGDTVLVQPDRYVENIDFDGHNIVVGSLFLTNGDEEEFIEQTIIDGGGDDCVVAFEDRETRDAVLTGFTLVNGYRQYGGGIVCRGSEPTLTHLVIRDNDAETGGGGIFCRSGSNPLIQHVFIENNRAAWGGGVYSIGAGDFVMEDSEVLRNFARSAGGGVAIRGSDPILCRVNVFGNTAQNAGGAGFFISEGSNPALEDVTVSWNRTNLGSGGGFYIWDAEGTYRNLVVTQNTAYYWAGGFWISSSDLDLEHVVIAFNSDRYGAAGIKVDREARLGLRNVTVYGNITETRNGGGLWSGEAETILVNTIFWGNRPMQIYGEGVSAIYSDIQDGYDGEGNIDEDPLFVDPDDSDYHLTEDSPCIDAGDPDSEPDPDDTRADMGAFYFPQEIPAPDIQVLPDSIAFPLTAVGAREEVVLAIHNSGDDTLDVSSQAILDEVDPFFIINGEEAFQLMPQTTHETTISFEPMEEGEFDAVFRIECNDPDEEVVEIPIIGTAILMVPDIEVDTDSLYYGNNNLGVIAEMVVTIFSVGNAPLLISDQYIDPADGWFFISAGEGGFELEPDSTHETIIAFAPREYGEFEALYVIESDDPDEEIIEIPLVGYVLSVDSNESGLPVEFGTHSIYPNPFNSITRISYSLAKLGYVSLVILDLSGHEVVTLKDDFLTPGEYQLKFDSTALPSGIYMLKLKAGRQIDVKKLVCIR